MQTIAPLAQSLLLRIDSSFRRGEEADLVQRAKAIDGTVLIAWHPREIPKIAALIDRNNPGNPEGWPRDRSDLVWVFDRNRDDSWSFAEVPQGLMPMDPPDKSLGKAAECLRLHLTPAQVLSKRKSKTDTRIFQSLKIN